MVYSKDLSKKLEVNTGGWIESLVFSLRKYGVTPNFSEEGRGPREGALKKMVGE